MGRRVACVAFASLLGLGSGGCANIWGFADLTSENSDGASDSEAGSGDTGNSGDGGASDGTVPTGDAAVDAPDGSLGCFLANSGSCRGLCPGNAANCGCLPDPTTQTTYCGLVGSGRQGTNCSTDLDCAPGYGCLMSMGTCAHWCRMGSTMCPSTVTSPVMTTTCHSSPMFTYNTDAYYYCY
jgi:hypothetical protein